MNYQDIASNGSPLYECILKRGDEIIHKRFKPIDKDFLYDFIYDITKTSRPKMWDIIREVNLWNESNISMVKGFEERTWVEEGMNTVEDIILDNAPIFLIEKKQGYHQV